MRFFEFPLLAFLAVGCSSEAQPDINHVLSVHEVLENLDSLNGKRVKVAGFMPKCGGYDCALFSSKESSEMFLKVLNSPGRTKKLPDFLSFGYDQDFDRKAESLVGRYVIVTAHVSNECRPNGVFSCTDRADDLIPIDIALASAQSPAKSTS